MLVERVRFFSYFLLIILELPHPSILHGHLSALLCQFESSGKEAPENELAVVIDTPANSASLSVVGINVSPLPLHFCHILEWFVSIFILQAIYNLRGR